jgi:hypothetical protein
MTDHLASTPQTHIRRGPTTFTFTFCPNCGGPAIEVLQVEDEGGQTAPVRIQHCFTRQEFVEFAAGVMLQAVVVDQAVVPHGQEAATRVILDRVEWLNGRLDPAAKAEMLRRCAAMR